MADRIPVLVVAGFLGSGKTTLVRHLLADARRRGERLAVVANDFGELGIDQALLGQSPGDYVELAGGCVCCKLSDALVETLEALHTRARPDRIAIETSGVALPYDTQLHLWREPVCSWVGDDLAVVVVNAEQVAEARDLDDCFAQQVSSADLLLLNQVDRVAPERIPAVEATLREVEPEAPIVHCVQGAVAPELLFPPDVDRVRREHDATPRPHVHDAFRADTITFASGVSGSEIEARVRGSLRAKGFVETSEGLRLLQAVGPRVELRAVDAPPPPDLVGRVVVIRRAP